MSKTLVIFRHGKSSWNNPFLGDFDRTLNERGREQTPKMAKLLSEIVTPEKMFVSSAKRTMETAELILSSSGFDPAIVSFSKDLYLADIRIICHFLKTIPKSINSVMFVGHNPGLTDLVNALSTYTLDNLPTASFAVIKWEKQTWEEIATSYYKGELVELKLAREF